MTTSTTHPATRAQTGWETPLFRWDTGADAEYSSQLHKFILDRTRTTPTSMVGIKDADKTASDLLRADHETIPPLREWILRAATALNEHVGAGRDTSGREVPMVAEAWAVVYREEGIHQVHSHHDAAWSGVYYVHTGRMEPGTGQLQFLDPRPAATAREPHRVALHTIDPFPGLLVAFPAWLRHWVTPYQGDSDRTVVAFNVGFRPTT